MRLIDADALLDKFEWKQDSQLYIRAIRATIKAEPSIDAVPVIRCKDCKYYKENTLVCSRYGLEDDDYCSWAERKES